MENEYFFLKRGETIVKNDLFCIKLRLRVENGNEKANAIIRVEYKEGVFKLVDCFFTKKEEFFPEFNVKNYEKLYEKIKEMAKKEVSLYSKYLKMIGDALKINLDECELVERKGDYDIYKKMCEKDGKNINFLIHVRKKDREVKFSDFVFESEFVDFRVSSKDLFEKIDKKEILLTGKRYRLKELLKG